ncbi:MAG: hypothetical protein JWM10_5157, partial [Myxococcaceae bacterium]|nr:hypothetical protein [Myxococcaceae bacterium]
MRTCPNVECPHRTLTGQRAAFADDRERCSDCESVLLVGAAEEEAEPAPPAAPSNRRWRALATAGVIGAFEVARRVPSPFLSSDQFLDDESFAVVAGISPLAVAVSSAASAFVVVEVVAMVIPALRRRRHDHPAARGAMTAAAWALAAFLTLSQAWFYAEIAVRQGMSETACAPYAASFVAGLAALFAVVRALEGRTLGGVWPALIAWSLGATMVDHVATLLLGVDLSPGRAAAQLALVAAWVALGRYFLRRRFGLVAASARPGLATAVYRETVAREGVAMTLRAPLWGAVPLTLAALTPNVLRFLQAMHVGRAGELVASWDASPWLRAGVDAAFALGVMALFARLPTSLRTADAR